MKMTDIFPGLKDVGAKVYEGVERLVVQGSAEFAQALFTQGPGYVPYGRGQGAPKDHDHPTPEVTQPEIAPNQQEQERGGMER